MSEETKLAKFEVIVQEIHTWIGTVDDYFVLEEYKNWSDMGFNFMLKNNGYHPGFLDKYAVNPYVEKILKSKDYDYASNENDLLEFIKEYKSSSDESGTFYDRKYQRNQMIFWLLFLAALDDEIYNNELDSIIDIAYCMDFDEAMIRDWCRAVEYVMQGNRFSESCNLKCESGAGKQFFLHEGAIEAGRATAMDAVTAANSALTSSIASITKSLFQR